MLALAACQRADEQTSAAVPAASTASTVSAAPAVSVTAASGPTAAASSSGHRISVPARIDADHPAMRITLVADAPPGADGVLRVQALEIGRADGSGPVQRIDGLSTDTPWSDSAPGLQVLDMNFDGHADLRLIESRPAGPNVPYLNWLFDPASGQFVASPALNELTSPRFEAATREVVMDWRDGAARSGTDTFAFRDGRLVPLRRETRDYRSGGAHTLKEWRWSDTQWRLMQTREVAGT